MTATTTDIAAAFAAVCQEAEPAEPCYLSLYAVVPFYGGPEEGGWWGHDVVLVASQYFPTPTQAKAAEGRVKALAKQLHEEARREFGQHCLNQMEWLEARGLDADYLGEVDGETDYHVQIEDRPGASECRGSRHYE